MKIKDKLYEDNKDLLKIILLIGNKIVLQRQLRDIAIHFGISKNKDDFNDLITELIDSEILDELPYKGDSSNNRFLVLKNPYISYLAEEEEVLRGIKINKTSLGKKVTDERKIKSMYKMELAINLLSKRESISGIESFINYLYKETTLIHDKHRGLEMYNTFILQNKDSIDLQEEESLKIKLPLIVDRVKRTKSVPDRKGKTKNYVNEKIESRKIKKKGDYIEPVNFDEIKKQCIEFYELKEHDFENVSTSYYDNNFNSFLERNAIFTSMVSKNKTDIVKQGNKDIKVVTPILIFNMYLLNINDIADSKNITDKTKQVAEKIGQTYLMLKKFFGEEYLVGAERCLNCKYNEDSEYYEPVVNPENSKALLSCIRPCESTSGNDIYFKCKNRPKPRTREIVLNVCVCCKTRKELDILKRNCLKHSKTSLTKETREDNNIDYYIVNTGIEKTDLSNKININYRNFNFDVKYDYVKTHENIDKYNKAQAEKKAKKKESEEFLLWLHDSGLIDEFKEYQNNK